MFFDDWSIHKKEKISETILWEYNTASEAWDWNKMSTVVVKRVLEYGRPEDYYAMFQLYGGIDKVKNIAKRIPSLKPKELTWCCTLFGLKKEELECWIRTQSRKRLLNY